MYYGRIKESGNLAAKRCLNRTQKVTGSNSIASPNILIKPTITIDRTHLIMIRRMIRMSIICKDQESTFRPLVVKLILGQICRFAKAGSEDTPRKSY